MVLAALVGGKQTVAERPVVQQAGGEQDEAELAEFKEAERLEADLIEHGVDDAVGGRAHEGHGAAERGGEGHGHQNLAGRDLGGGAHAHDHGHGHGGRTGVRQHGGEAADRDHGEQQQFLHVAFGQLQGRFAHLIGETGDEGGFADDEHGHEQHHGVVAEVAEGHLRGQYAGRGQRDRNEHGRDGQRQGFGHEQQRGDDENTKSDIGFGGIAGYGGPGSTGRGETVKAAEQEHAAGHYAECQQAPCKPFHTDTSPLLAKKAKKVSV